MAREWLRHPRLVTPCAASHSAIESPSCGGRLTKPPPGHTTIAAPVACPGAGRNTRTAMPILDGENGKGGGETVPKARIHTTDFRRLDDATTYDDETVLVECRPRKGYRH